MCDTVNVKSKSDVYKRNESYELLTERRRRRVNQPIRRKYSLHLHLSIERVKHTITAQPSKTCW